MNNLNIKSSSKSKETTHREPKMTNNKSQTENMSNLPKIRTVYADLIDYLKTIMFQKGILTNPSYAELSKKLGFTYNSIKERKHRLRKHFPQKKTFNDLYNRLSKQYKANLQKEWPLIEQKFIQLYVIAFPSNPKIPSIKNPHQSIKRKFFNDIKQIIQEYFPKARIFDTDLSRLLYSKARTLKDAHFKKNRTNRKLTLSILFSYIRSIRNLTATDFIERVRDIQTINDKKLKRLKKNLDSYIEQFIFSNPYKSKYINDIYDMGTVYFKPEYNLTLDVWIELSKGRSKTLLIKVARRELEYSSYGRLDKFGLKGRGNVYSWYGIIKMTKQLTKLLPQNIVYDLVPKFKHYINIRNLHPIYPRIYHRSWYTKSTVKFHIIMLILRDLGLEIINLEPINPIAFKKTDIMEIYTYERHHIFPNDKLSIDVNRLVLTMHKNHAKLERKKDLILQLIQSRINLTIDCPYYYKKRFSDWKTKWQQYLKRRSYLIENGFEKFIRKYFTDENGHNYIIERFFNKTLKGKMEPEISAMIVNWIKKKRPVPVLNPIISTKLLDGAPELIKRGYFTT